MKKFVLITLLLSGIANAHQSYVVPTYSNGAIVPIIQNELNQGDGGFVNYYQGKLIIHASANDYARIQQLLTQIDTTPAPVRLTVLVGDSIREQSQSANIGIGIDSRVHIYGNTSFQNTHRTHQGTYQVRGTAGLPMSIGKSTLLQLSGLTTISTQGVQFRFINTKWVTLSNGITAVATPLPNGQVQITLSQNHATQTLHTTIIINKNDWTKVGEIAQSNHTNTRQSQHSLPIWIWVD